MEIVGKYLKLTKLDNGNKKTQKHTPMPKNSFILIENQVMYVKISFLII